MTLLTLIESDPQVRVSLETTLHDRGYEVVVARNGLAGLQVVIDRRPHAIVLDLNLPDIDGLEILKMLRAVSDVPIVVASARDQDRDIVRTLEAGADDYIVKPISVDRLDARLRALLRRTHRGLVPTIIVGRLVIDSSARVVILDGETLELSRKEFDLLAYLANRIGRVVTKRELLGAIWEQPWGGAEKTIDVHLSWLRRKLGESASEPRYLRSVRGVGVKLVDPEAPGVN